MSFNMPLYPEEENLAKVVKFEEGSISAIGLKLDKVTPPSGERPGDIVLFTRKSTISGSVAKFDFWAKSKNWVSGIQRLTDSQTLEKATLRQNRPESCVEPTRSQNSTV